MSNSSHKLRTAVRGDDVIKENLIEKKVLDNGLTLEMFDHSRYVAGDRWLVSFEARIEVEVKPEYLEGLHNPSTPFKDIQALVGKTVSYVYEKERNFVAETEKDVIFKQIKGEFLESTLGYLSGPTFAGRLVLRRYQEALSPVPRRRH